MRSQAALKTPFSDPGALTDFAVYTLDSADQWAAALRRMLVASADIYFSPDYYASWQGTTPGTATCLHARIGDIEVLYPFFKSEIPGTDGYFDIASAYGYGGAITSGPFDETTQQVFDTLVSEWCEQERVVAEFVREYPGAPFRASSAGNRVLVRYNVSVDTVQPLEEIWGGLRGSARRAVRKATGHGLTVQVDDKLTTRHAFQALYRETSERAGFSAFYQFDPDYFERTKAQLAKHTVILNVCDGDRIAASALCFHWGDVFTYHLGASSRTWSAWRPSDLVYWAMIEEAKRRGCRRLHLGGGMSTNRNDTLYQFKSKFASFETPVHIGTFVHNREVYERLCADWAKHRPDLIATKGHYFLRYRETD